MGSSLQVYGLVDVRLQTVYEREFEPFGDSGHSEAKDIYVTLPINRHGETEIMSSNSGFWADLQERLQGDPEFAQQYLLDWVKLTTVDRLVNKLDEQREALGMTKAGLAKAIHRDPAAVRRLLSDASGNPTVESVSSIAAAVGFRLELVPMDESERLVVSEPLREFADC